MNRRVYCLAFACAAIAASSACFAAKPYASRIRNGGFEYAKHGKLQGWKGAFELVTDKALAHAGNNCVRIKTKGGEPVVFRSNARRMYYTIGLRHQFSIWAKGKGELRLGYDTCPKQDKTSPYTPHMWQAQGAKLTGQWQQIAYDFWVLDPQGARRINVCVELRGQGADALLDDAALVAARPAATTMDIFPIHGMVAKRGAIDLEVRIENKGKLVKTGDLEITTQIPNTRRKVAALKIDASGLTKYRFTAPADVEIDAQAGYYCRFLVVHKQSGEARCCSVEVVDKATYAAFEAAAKRVKLDTPAHVLFIGDSLSDLYRRFNFADKVGYWLRKVNGPQVSYKNVGVGGDFITRVWDRLNQNPRVYRIGAYEGIFDPKPTIVFIFLGHNDSKINSKSGIPCVPRKVFAEQFPLVINKIKAATGARVIVMSASSSAFEVISKNWPVWEKKRPRGFSKFGIPAVMEEFNAMMKKAAADRGAEYLDVYTPTKNYPNKPDLFIRDGVHVNNLGNRVLALEILKYLGKK